LSQLPFQGVKNKIEKGIFIIIKKCIKCGMLRSQKDMVLLEDLSYLCFSCWNKYLKANEKKSKK
jgi:formylmethanofuran dehydrogenase subunit E